MKKLSSIIIIDDDSLANFLNETIIRDADCTEYIHVFQTAVKGLDFLSQSLVYEGREKGFERNSLILLDLHMPPPDGWTFLKEYLQLPEVNRKKYTVIILSASINPEDLQRANSIADVSGFYNKPLTHDILMEILHKHFADHFL